MSDSDKALLFQNLSDMEKDFFSEILDELRVQSKPSQEIFKYLTESLKTKLNTRIESLDFQKKFYHFVLENLNLSLYPPESKFLDRFMKLVSSAIERTGCALYDPLCELIAENCCSISTTNDQPYYITYDFKKSENAMNLWERNRKPAIFDEKLTEKIIFKVFPKFYNVGLACWEAGFFICELFLENPTLFEGKSVFEIGSGVGMTAIFLKKFTKCGKVIMSDYQDLILRNCEENMKINGISSKIIEKGETGNLLDKRQELDNSENLKKEDDKIVEIHNLDWTDYTKAQIEYFSSMDWMMCADCVYDVKYIPELVKLLADIFALNPKMRCWFAITERNEKTFSFFKEACEKQNNLIIENVTKSNPRKKHFEYGFDDLINLYEIRK